MDEVRKDIDVQTNRRDSVVLLLFFLHRTTATLQ